MEGEQILVGSKIEEGKKHYNLKEGFVKTVSNFLGDTLTIDMTCPVFALYDKSV